jgi:dethiobiotin synthetase
MTPMTRPRPLRGLAVVGTDTGVGKTMVAAGLLRLASNLRVSVLPFKPAETGCPALDRPADALLLRDAARRPDLPLDAVCPHRFRPPVAPAAATPAGRPLRLAPLAAAARHLGALGAHALLIEGAGGLLSPYAPRLTILDLVSRLGLDLLLVSRNSLGTINHTSLAVAEIRRRGLPLLGYVLVDTLAEPRRSENNENLIRSSTGLRPYARLHYISKATPDSAATALARAPAVRRYLRALSASASRARRPD